MRIVYFIILFTFTFKISKNQGLTNSLANISHENLLDNAWFTVNQRGETSSYFADRWIKFTSELTFTNNEGVTISGTPSSEGSNLGTQKIEWDRLKDNIGKSITISVLINGTIYKAVGKIETPTSSWKSHADVYIASLNIWFTLLTYGTSPSTAELYIKNINTDTINVTIKAVKLELGSVSTLDMDTVPNYQQELAKCQRYYEQNSWYSWNVKANLDGVIDVMTSYPFLVKKRVNNITTNILKQNIGNGQLVDLTTSTIIPSNEVTISQPVAYNSRMESVKITHNSIISGHTYYFSIGDDCIAFSADL